jgi:transcription antitermination factor NusG
VDGRQGHPWRHRLRRSSEQAGPALAGEVDRLLKREQAERPRTRAQFSIGESVKVVSGPLSDFSGEISEVMDDASKLRSLSLSLAARLRSKSASTR